VRVCSVGVPLAVSLAGGNRNDVTQLMPLIQAIPPVRAPAEDPGSGVCSSEPAHLFHLVPQR
jgi:hypothetical protein